MWKVITWLSCCTKWGHQLELSQSIYMLFAGREVHIGKNCAKGLEFSRPRPRAQFFPIWTDLGWQITCLFFSSIEYFVSSFCVEFSLQPFSNLVYACVWHLGNRKSNQHYTHSWKLRNDFIYYLIRSYFLAFVLQWTLGLLTFLRLH